MTALESTDNRQDYLRAQLLDPFNANQYLITTSLYEIEPTDPHLSKPGDMIYFMSTKARLDCHCVQGDTKLHNVSVVSELEPHLPWFLFD